MTEKTATKANPKLWEKIVAQVKKAAEYGKANSWNARKAQHAVKLYKEAGGKYIGGKSSKNSLSKWTEQDWQYNPKAKTKARYLPKKVWEKLTSKERSVTNKEKQEAIKKGKKKAPYSKKVAKLVKKA